MARYVVDAAVCEIVVVDVVDDAAVVVVAVVVAVIVVVDDDVVVAMVAGCFNRKAFVHCCMFQRAMCSGCCSCAVAIMLLLLTVLLIPFSLVASQVDWLVGPCSLSGMICMMNFNSASTTASQSRVAVLLSQSTNLA